MQDARSLAGAQTVRTVGAEDIAPTSFQCYSALAIALLLVVIALLAALFGRDQGPEVKSLIPIAAAIWSLTNLLTAFLLLAQFYVNGRRFFGFLAVAYAFIGLLTWPYLVAFSGVFRVAVTLGDFQPSIYLWSIWHCLFPLLIIYATINDSALGRIVTRKAVHAATIIFAIVPIVVSTAIATIIFTHQDSLPHLSLGGHFHPLYRAIFVPLAITLSGFSCIILLNPSRLTPLKVTLALAVFSSGLDASLNLSSSAFSYAWDASKLMTVFTSSIVLLMMLCDIAGFYGRIARIANIDILTSLKNRRALEEHISLAFQNARRLRGSLSLLVIDIDHFKRYNDSFGHSGGDECLRRVAQAIDECVTRPLDMVGRFGGEEFVVVLPDTPLQAVLVLAERMRSAVQDFEVLHEGKALGPVTVSIGVGHAVDASRINNTALFEAADRGLYQAKAGGRNCVTLGSNDSADALGHKSLKVPSAVDLGLSLE